MYGYEDSADLSTTLEGLNVMREKLAVMRDIADKVKVMHLFGEVSIDKKGEEHPTVTHEEVTDRDVTHVQVQERLWGISGLETPIYLGALTVEQARQRLDEISRKMNGVLNPNFDAVVHPVAA